MAEMFNAVVDRPQSNKPLHTPPKKRVYFIITACVAALALTVSATLAVSAYLGLREQQKLTTQQDEQLASLQAIIDAQQQQLSEQESTLSDQQDTIASQESTIREQQDTITSQENTIKQQKDTITKLQNANRANSVTPPPSIQYIGGVTYPTVDVSALAGKKLIALTFDDGPGPYTGRLLDALKARGARATFFVLGSKVNSNASLIKRMDDEGHVVGNHSLNHKNLRNLSLAGINSEMGTTAELIKNVTGHYPYLMRCPGGNANTTVFNYAKQIGIPIIYWSVDTRDWEYRNAATVLANATANTKDGSIVLMHDIYSTTVEAAIRYIDNMQAQGYTFVTVPELLAARYGTVEPGKTYVNGYK